MVKRQSKGSLADRIAGVLSAVPAQFNPDDDHIDDTTAKLTDFDDEQDDEDDDKLLSKFRRQNVDLLADVDKRYAGKKGSRKSLHGDSSDEVSEEGSLDHEDYDDEQDLNENDSSNSDTTDNDDDDADDADGKEDQDSTKQDSEESDNQENGSEGSDNEGSVAISEENETDFQHMHDTNVSQQVKKGLCVRNQMGIWENLLEVRIQLQKCLSAANKMPQGSNYKELVRGNTELSFKEKVKETNNSIANVLEKLLILQNLAIKKYPETTKLGKKELKKVSSDDENEEIPSDTEDELVHDHSDSEEDIKSRSPKRRKLNDYETDIIALHETYKIYRNETIEKWNTKTRLSVTKNAGQPHSVVNHIEHILSDKEKLRKKTQLKRSEYKILGEEDKKEENLRSNEDDGDLKQAEEYNTEIFDDDDFYHQLLRELIEVKSTDITDPVQLGRQWIQLQNLRSKMKRKIDTRATKGRKIRYAIHSKLVNFMAPFNNQAGTEEAKNELFNSLFGKTQSKSARLSRS